MGFSFAANDLVEAFVCFTADHKAHGIKAVAFSMRCQPYGYIRVFGPGANPSDPSTARIVIERYNGAVALRDDAVATAMHAVPRTADPITTNPAGYSCGPDSGPFRWVVEPKVTASFPTPLEFVRALAAAFSTNNIRW